MSGTATGMYWPRLLAAPAPRPGSVSTNFLRPLEHRREGSGLVTAFLQWHLERGVRSLRLVERV